MHSAKPQLAYVVHSLNPGGTERLVVDMSLAFASEFSVTVFCLDEPGSWAADLRRHGVPVHCMWRQPGLDISIPVKLARHFRTVGTNVVHAHQCTPWFYAALSRILYRKPRLILEEHGRFYPEVESRKRRWINRAIIRRLTHRFVAVSKDIRKRLVRYEGLDDEQVEIVYNGVQTPPTLSPRARRAMRGEFGFGENNFVVGTIGRFDSIKNLPMLVDSLIDTFGYSANLRGLIVGDGPLFAEIDKLVESRGVSDRICLTGYRSDARKLVQCMDLFVLSSLSEGTSMALLEAMAGAVPVVVTDVGGNPEIVVRGTTGWVVPSQSAESLAAAIREALTDSEKTTKFSGQGKSRIAELFTFERMIKRYREIYAELLSRATA